MKRILAMTIAPLMVSAAFVGSAVADSTKMKSETSAQAETGVEAGTDSELDLGTTASTGAQANFGSVISAIQANGAAAADVEAVTDASTIEIVRVSDIAQGESMNALDNALEQNQAEVDELRSAIEANATVSGELEAEQVQVDDVVAAEAEADGSLVVYVR